MRRFQRKIESFHCDHCGLEVTGNGYTNHCPRCLWSKHVDINPGDRLEQCQGMMEPVEVQVNTSSCIITHRCETCGFERRQKSSVHDDFDMIVSISVQQSGRRVA